MVVLERIISSGCCTRDERDDNEASPKMPFLFSKSISTTGSS